MDGKVLLKHESQSAHIYYGALLQVYQQLWIGMLN